MYRKHPVYTALAATLAVFAALGFWLAPWLLEKNAVEIVQRDFGAELRVERIEANPFRLSLRINGLELDNPGGQPTARIAIHDSVSVTGEAGEPIAIKITLESVAN